MTRVGDMAHMLGIGITFPKEVSTKIDEIRRRFGTPRVREVVPHITLKQPFTPKVDIGVIVDRLRSIGTGTSPFVVVLDGFDYFEGERNLAFIAVEGSKPLRELHSQIVTSLRGLSEGGEEHQLAQFVPHLTVHDGIPRDQLASFKARLAARGFNAEVELDSFVLFANDGTGWKHIDTFKLAGKRTVPGWERIYTQRGDLGFRVLPKIASAARTFKERNYHKILDLGCGTGRHSIFLAKQGFRVDATDSSATAISIAGEKAKSLNLDNVHFKQHDMRRIPFRAGSFDAVICTWTIYHATLNDIEDTMGEIMRVLKSNGLLVTDFLSTEDSTYGLGREIQKNTFVGQKPGEEDVPHHYSTRDELVHLLRGFRETRIRLHSRAYEADGVAYLRKYFDVQAMK